MTSHFASLPSGYRPATDALADRTILVTGASGGLGRAAAIACARHGATVILHGRSVPKLEALYDEIETAGAPQPAIMPLDFLSTTQAEMDGFAQTIHGTFGRLDGIFHAANHFSNLSPLILQDLDTWQKYLFVNVAAPAALTKACMPILKRAPSASVIFVSETHAVEPRAYWGAFAASKSVLPSIATIWQDEQTEGSGVRFNVCVPGPVASPVRSKSHPAEADTSLLRPEQLTPHFIYLLGSDSMEIKGAIYQCQVRNTASS